MISAVSSSRHPSGICRHAANLVKCLLGSERVSRITLLVGCWQEKYFRVAFGIGAPIPPSYTKLEIVAVEIKNDALARNRWYLSGLPGIIKRHTPDLVHLSFPIPFLRESIRPPVVLSLHDLYPYDAPENFGFPRVLFNRLFLHQCLSNADSVACVSRFTLGRLQQIAPQIAAVKATCVYQCVALDTAQPVKPGVCNLMDRPFLLAVAQHRNNKNLELLLKAFAGLRNAGLRDSEVQRSKESAPGSLALVLLGSQGPRTDDILQLARKLLLEDDLVFASELKDAELCWLYQRCELFVTTSTVEGFGMPVAEAMLCGSRIVCSDIPVFREIGSDYCHFVDVKGEFAIAALTEAMHQSMLRPRPAPRQLSDFSIEEMGSRYLSLYLRILANRPPCRCGR